MLKFPQSEKLSIFQGIQSSILFNNKIDLNSTSLLKCVSQLKMDEVRDESVTFSQKHGAFQEISFFTSFPCSYFGPSPLALNGILSLKRGLRK